MRERLLKIILIIILLSIILFVGGSLYSKIVNYKEEKPKIKETTTGRLNQGEVLLDSSIIEELTNIQ